MGIDGKRNHLTQVINYEVIILIIIALGCISLPVLLLGGAGTLFFGTFLYLHRCDSQEYSFLFCILIDVFCVFVMIE